MSKCIRCKSDKDGNGAYCVLCYAKMMKPCPKCMIRSAGGKFHVMKRGNAKRPLDCSLCGNERWVLIDERGVIRG